MIVPSGRSILAGVLVCRILGPVEVEIDGTVVDLGGPVPRRLLAALAAAEGRAVPDGLLTDQVWGADGPTQAMNALRVAVSRLRNALGPVAARYLRRTDHGYVLDLPPDSTDSALFTALIERGRRQAAAGESVEASGSFDEALAWWRGEPWHDLGDRTELSGPRARLTELRDVAVEEQQAARLACGDTAAAVAALSEAVTFAPYRERRWELLALALYRSGRQAQALAELRRVRELLIEELGIEPGPALRELEQRMLDQDPELLLPKRVIAVASPPRSQRTDGRSGLPRPLSSLIGRTEELDHLRESLEQRRLVSLSGPAGVGKTRLAVEYAATVEDEVWFVRLADVRTTDAVTPSVAEAIGVVTAEDDPIEAVRRVLADRGGLLVLDNCEHVVEAAADLALTLLRGCATLRILTTTRQRLGVDGEYVVAVDPLAVQDDSGGDGPAVALLLDRARMVRPRWSPAPPELDAAREICTILDGLPLALEIAAAREHAFGFREIVAHLRERLDVLGGTPRGSISPHASLDAAIGWSIDHLAASDRAVLQRLWPFEGGFTWQAAAAVQPADRSQGSVLAVLAAVAERSVIGVDRTAQPVRYRMLETIRRYCQSSDPDPTDTEAAHAAWVRDTVDGYAAIVTGHRVGAVFRAVAGELANIKAGIAHLIAHDPVTALRTAAALEWAWVSVGALTEGLRLVGAALAACPEDEVQVRARGLCALSIMSQHAGRPADSVRYANSAIELLGDDLTGERGTLLLTALVNRGGGAAELGDVALSRANVDRFRAEAAHRAVPPWIVASAMLGEAGTLLMERRRDEGEAMLHAARAYAAECGFTWVQGTADIVLARSLLRGREPDPQRARLALEALDRAWTVFEDQANVFDSLAMLYTGAHALAVLGDHRAAVEIHTAVVEHAARVGADPRRLARLAGQQAEHRMRQLLEQQGSEGRDAKAGPLGQAAIHDLLIAATARLDGLAAQSP
ncbi:AfsR/SARP family transcriptional regulator [Nocardia sp. NPDC004722]